ncbi:hypothetical protein HMPREF9625_01491 [Oribacterium parvum ACB1]|uniref:DUF5722 domain-containing protein n=1 Tax=Oribacterium parvum ACB1 TaxID=796943 RepID=G9WQ58_9FIRM|nr:DUF5722 domain-containing protein [Oribacterium parvum]EHL09518.1 hypothetical protein HMPREF9625_01491 [Oribacterium parvum ACB1]
MGLLGKKSIGLFCALAMSTLFSFGAFAHSISGKVRDVGINQEKDKISVTVDSSGDSSGTDGSIYIFEIKPYQNDLSGRTDYLAKGSIGANQTFSFPLHAGPGELRLYSAFVPAVKVGGRYEMIANRRYIENPEIVAENQDPALNPGKKGLRVDPNILDDALSLNIKHAGVDIPTQRFFGNGIDYTYESKTYKINKELIDQLDAEVKRLSDSGVAVTAILLNAWNQTVPELNPLGVTELPKEQAVYYGFNVESEAGFRAVKAMASFLAKRYNGKNGHGKITNWVVGNEINNQYWNYMGDFDVSAYTSKFQRAFRVFYTAMKSVSANDNIMFSIDHYWNMLPEAAPVGKYKGKDILLAFHNYEEAEGYMDYGLALHPYPYPIYSPNFWDDDKTGRVNDTVDSPIVNFKNLHVITDFMSMDSMKNRKGEVRKIFLTEEGFSSIAKGVDKSTEQAAAVAYSYFIVDNNPYISAYLMSRQEDNDDETKHGLAFGLSSIVNHQLVPKPAHEVFKWIDNPSATEGIADFARAVIGIDSWDQLIPNFRFPGR